MLTWFLLIVLFLVLTISLIIFSVQRNHVQKYSSSFWSGIFAAVFAIVSLVLVFVNWIKDRDYLARAKAGIDTFKAKRPITTFPTGPPQPKPKPLRPLQPLKATQ